MSFILDALKKSESERQQQGSTEFAAVPTAIRAAGMPRWLWVVSILLLVNLVVLIGLFLRPDSTPAASTPSLPAAVPVIEPTPKPSTFEEELLRPEVTRP